MDRHHTLASRLLAWMGCCVAVFACLVAAPVPTRLEARFAGVALAAQDDPESGSVSESLARAIALKDGDHLIVCNELASLSMTDDVDGSGHLRARRVSHGLFDDTITYTAGTIVLHAVAVSGSGFYLMSGAKFLSVVSGDLAFTDETGDRSVWQTDVLSNGDVLLYSVAERDEDRYYLGFDGHTFAAMSADDAKKEQNGIALFATPAHVCVEIRTEPTCTQDGHIVRTCVSCGETTELSIPATGHDWGPWAVSKKATAEEEGIEKRICNNNPNHIETRVIPVASMDSSRVTITYELDDGHIEGVSDTFSVTYATGTEIVILDAPTKEGYVFEYWESPRYRLSPGETLTVTADDTFRAIWRRMSESELASAEAGSTDVVISRSQAAGSDGFGGRSTPGTSDPLVSVTVVGAIACTGGALMLAGRSW